MIDDHWQVWIDVGGTFTDCLATSPEGDTKRHKLLSSGATLGVCDSGSTPSCLVDPTRGKDPHDFWTGYRLQLFNEAGEFAEESRIAGFDRATATLKLVRRLAHPPCPGKAYAIISDEEAPLLGIRYLLGLRRTAPLPALAVRLGTTRGTNALLTRTGARTALVTTRGFGDLWEIGNQDRPRLFELNIRKKRRLFETVVEVDERVSATGEVLQAVDQAAVRRQLERLKSRGIESLAICLMHAYAFPQHEQLIAAIADKVGFANVSLSSAVAPVIKIIPRGDTAMADAYLNPVLRAYVSGLQHTLRTHERSRLRLLTSAGGLVGAEHFSGKDSILSGPAGGVVACARTAEAAGFKKAIGFDMGGTSTDVSRFDGKWGTVYETEKNGVRIAAPMLAIETVAAGGGSVCQFDGVKLVVGPASAGAEPGPACYGRGGPLTITDMNLALGRVLPEHFPFPLDERIVHHKLGHLAEHIKRVANHPYTPTQLAADFLKVANAGMSKAIESVSIAEGCDPREYVLVCFGGAAPQHACDVAEELGISRVLHHPDGGMLSALGMGLADVIRHGVQGVYEEFSAAALKRARQLVRVLSRQARQEVRAEGIPPSQIQVRKSLDLRYLGQDASLTIDWPADDDVVNSFHRAHAQLFGFADVRACTGNRGGAGRGDRSPGETATACAACSPRRAAIDGMAHVYFGDQSQWTPVYTNARTCCLATSWRDRH